MDTRLAGISVRKRGRGPTTIGARLRSAISGQGYTLAAFAAESSIPYRTLQNYVADKRKPGADHLAKMLEAGVDMSWLLMGRERPLPSERAALDALSRGDDDLSEALQAISRSWEILPGAERAQYAKVLAALNSTVTLPVVNSGRVKGIPREWIDPRSLYGELADNAALADVEDPDGGSFLVEPPELPGVMPIPVHSEAIDDMTVGYLPFKSEWFDRRGLDAVNCVVLEMPSQSMEPTITGGAFILVDRAVRSAREDRAYVVTDRSGTWMVNRVARDGEFWTLESDNPDLSGREWLPGTEVAGEVVWTSRAGVPKAR